MQLTLEIESPNELQLLLQYIRLLSSVTVLPNLKPSPPFATSDISQEIAGAKEDIEWQHLTAAQFLQGYAEEDAIYDAL